MANRIEHCRLEGADRRFGYEFGVEGVLNTDEAIALTGYTRSWLDKLHEQGKVRKRRRAGGVGRIEWCKRSLLNYTAPVEL
jgi:hypothetical protein